MKPTCSTEGVPQLVRLIPKDASLPTRLRDVYETFASRRLSAGSVVSRFELKRDADTWTFELAEDFFVELTRSV